MKATAIAPGYAPARCVGCGAMVGVPAGMVDEMRWASLDAQVRDLVCDNPRKADLDVHRVGRPYYWHSPTAHLLDNDGYPIPPLPAQIEEGAW